MVTSEDIQAVAVQVEAIYSRWVEGGCRSSDISTSRDSILQAVDQLPSPDSGLTRVVAIYPDDHPIVHLNQTWTHPSPISFLMTLTPSPSHNRSVILVHPNLVINDTTSALFDFGSIDYSSRRVIMTTLHPNRCHDITWQSTQDYPPILARSGDRLIFHGSEGSTVTSCRHDGRIHLDPVYDLVIGPSKRLSIVVGSPGEYTLACRQDPMSRRITVRVQP